MFNNYLILAVFHFILGAKETTVGMSAAFQMNWLYFRPMCQFINISLQLPYCCLTFSVNLVSRPDGRTQFDGSFIKGCWKEYVKRDDEVTRKFEKQHNEEFRNLFTSKYCIYSRR